MMVEDPTVGTPTALAQSTPSVLTESAPTVLSESTPTGQTSGVGIDTVIEIPIGRRVMVVSDLLLTSEATPSSLVLTGELARTLDSWDGPGILIIAGNLFDLTGNAPDA